MLVNVHGLPGVTDPLVADGASSMVATLGKHVFGEVTLLNLVLILQTVSLFFLLFFFEKNEKGNIREGQKY